MKKIPNKKRKPEKQLWGGGLLVNSYRCSFYRVVYLFSSLGTFSSSSIRGPMIHPIDDCGHPLLYLEGIGIDLHERAISGTISKTFLAYAKVSGFGGCIWNESLGGAVSIWSFLLS
jgi:hypothetical protein